MTEEIIQEIRKSLKLFLESNFNKISDCGTGGGIEGTLEVKKIEKEGKLIIKLEFYQFLDSDKYNYTVLE